MSVEDGDDRLERGRGRRLDGRGPGESLDGCLDAFGQAGQPFVDRGRQTSALRRSRQVNRWPWGSISSGPSTATLRVTCRSTGCRTTGRGRGRRRRPRRGADRRRRSGRVLSAARGGTLVFGDLGGDAVVRRAGPDMLSGGARPRRRRAARRRAGDELRGGAGDDEIDGGDGDDALVGGSGDERVAGHAGTDGIEGGSGVDGLVGGAAAIACTGTCSRPARRRCVPPAGAVRLARGRGRRRRSSGWWRRREHLDGGGQDLAEFSTARAPIVIAMAGVTPDRAAAYGAPENDDELGGDVEGAEAVAGTTRSSATRRTRWLDGGTGDDEVEQAGGVDRFAAGPAATSWWRATASRRGALRHQTGPRPGRCPGRGRVQPGRLGGERVRRRGGRGRAARVGPVGACDRPSVFPGLGAGVPPARSALGAP